MKQIQAKNEKYEMIEKHGYNRESTMDYITKKINQFDGDLSINSSKLLLLKKQAN